MKFKEGSEMGEAEVLMGEGEESGDAFGEADPAVAASPGQEEAGEGSETAEDDCDRLKVAPDPGMPTQSEIDEHNATHYPFRSWCEYCVKARGEGEQHRGTDKSATSQVPVIAFDYLFITNGRVLRRHEMSEEDKERVKMTILVVKDTKSRALFAHAVRRKGADDEGYAVSRLVEDVKWLGYTKVILKSDCERAILRLMQEALKAIKTDVEGPDEVSYENPPAYDPRSNGSIENAVKVVKGMLRTVKLCLEARIEQRVPDDHPLMTWMVEHAAWLSTVCKRGEDGKTAFQRIRGRVFNKRSLEFGEKVLFKLHDRGPRHDERGALEARWRKGVMLGYSRFSNEYWLWDGSEPVKARTVQRLKSDLRWHRAWLEKVSYDVHSRYPARDRSYELGEPAEPAAKPEDPKQRAPQNVAIRQSDWMRHGSTEGCPKCAHADEHGWGKRAGPHSERCVERFTRLAKESEAGRQRIKEAEERQNRWIARRVQEGAEAPRDHREAEIPSQFENRREEAWEDVPGGERAPRTPSLGGDTPRAGQESQERADMEDGAQEEGDLPMSEEEYEPTSPGGEDEEMVENLMSLVTDEVREQVNEANVEILNVIRQLGIGGKAYRRERKAGIKAIISEIYSPPRVTRYAKLLPSLGIGPGFALDLTTVNDKGEPWDFDTKEKQEEAERLLEETQPTILVGSPMCTAYCAWQRLNKHRRDPAVVEEEKAKADAHLKFVCRLYLKQVQAGRYFLHEHPATATSWQEDCVEEVMRQPGVDYAVMDQCQYGQTAENGQPVKKPTKWMSNSEEILKQLQNRCAGRGGWCSLGGTHQVCSGSTARKAALYPFKLCKAILVGCRNQLLADRRMTEGIHGIHPQGAFDDEHEREILCAEWLKEECVDVEINSIGQQITYRDAMTGQMLDPTLVKAARKLELEYFASKQVWHKRTREEAFRNQGKAPITVKWVDVNKGDEQNPKYRSRLVAREIRKPGEDSIFAPTPPLEALRTVLSHAATDMPGRKKHVRDEVSDDRTQVSVIDIKRAYFNAKKSPEDNPTYVDLPEEDTDKARGMCGLLRVHMYGTRAAADGWHHEYSHALVTIGFTKGDASACVFRHPSRGLVTSVHGDDFTTSGSKKNLDWLRQELEKAYELDELARLGPGKEDSKEAKILNRIIRWTAKGLEYEADPRQAEKVVVDLGLEGANTVGTAGMQRTKESLNKDPELPPSKHTAFRGIAARCNYLAADRPDIQFAAKEICRWMSTPSEAGVTAMKRLGRYLEGHRRVVLEFPFQEANTMDVYSDTDWAGCLKTRRSTSGGCLMMGKHLIKSWSSTQTPISLSSGEAEFYGVVKASGIALGYQALLHDLGIEVPIRIWTDSSATMGICGRQGLGKLRHVDTRSLWVQQRVRDGSLELRKVRGEVNPADLFTKHLSSEDRVTSLLNLLGSRYTGGRAVEAPKLRRTEEEGKGLLACEMVYAVVGKTVVQEGYVYPAVEVDGVYVAEAYLHDERSLPHLIAGDINELFPKALAAPALPEQAEQEDWLETRGAALGKGLGTESALNCCAGRLSPAAHSEEESRSSGSSRR